MRFSILGLEIMGASCEIEPLLPRQSYIISKSIIICKIIMKNFLWDAVLPKFDGWIRFADGWFHRPTQTLGRHFYFATGVADWTARGTRFPSSDWLPPRLRITGRNRFGAALAEGVSMSSAMMMDRSLTNSPMGMSGSTPMQGQMPGMSAMMQGMCMCKCDSR